MPMSQNGAALPEDDGRVRAAEERLSEALGDAFRDFPEDDTASAEPVADDTRDRTQQLRSLLDQALSQAGGKAFRRDAEAWAAGATSSPEDTKANARDLEDSIQRAIEKVRFLEQALSRFTEGSDLVARNRCGTKRVTTLVSDLVKDIEGFVLGLDRTLDWAHTADLAALEIALAARHNSEGSD